MVVDSKWPKVEVRPNQVHRQSDITSGGVGFSGDGGPTDIERMYKSLLDFSMRDSYQFWVVRKFINDAAKIHLYESNNVGPHMSKDEICNHVLFHSGAWQALTLLWERMGQESLQIQLDNVLGKRLDMEETYERT